MHRRMWWVTASLMLGARPLSAANIDFPGRLLIAVEPAASRADVMATTAVAPFTLAGWEIEPIVTVEPAPSGVGIASVHSRWPLVAWIAAKPPRGAVAGARPRVDWDLVHQIVDGDAPDTYVTVHNQLFAGSPDHLPNIEPEVDYIEERLATLNGSGTTTEVASETQDGECPAVDVPPDYNKHWPHSETFAWHLGSAYSQLGDARRAALPAFDGGGPIVTIAHLDTGYSSNVAMPRQNLDLKGSSDFSTGTELGCDGDPNSNPCVDPCHKGFWRNCGHGTETLGVLAGGCVRTSATAGPPFADDLGGAPKARVVEYRISDSVIHVTTGRMTAAINKAASDGVDVISMSMGGLPSAALRDAVNGAYRRGVAMFTATGNYFELPLLPFLHTPSLVVFPARFDRVVAVAGLTLEKESYFRPPSYWSWLGGDWDGWMMRGNVGPEWVMEEAISAYTPNVAWAQRSQSHLIMRNGGGTSAATPQVAAAAALWLQVHRDEFADATWHTPEKVEAVYGALLTSAEPSTTDHRYPTAYFGAGPLRALEALKRNKPTTLNERAEASIGFEWLVDLFDSMVQIPARVNEPAATWKRRGQLHLQLVGTELAQLTVLSKSMQAIIGERRPEELQRDPIALRRLFDEARRQESASNYLKALSLK